MTKRLAKTALLMLVLSFATFLLAQSTPTNLQINQNGQGAEGVSVYVLVGGNKFSTGMPPTGITNSSGNFTIPAGLLSANKAVRMKAYKVCVNGQKVLFMIPVGAESLLPQDTKDCRNEFLGFFLLGGGDVIVDFTNNTVTQQSVHGGGGHSFSTGQLIGLQAGGGIGLDSLSGVNSCSAPGVIRSGCSTSDKAFAFDVGADLLVLKYFQVSGAYIRGNSTNRTVGASGSSSATDQTQPQNESITFGPRFPIGPVTLFAGGGLNFFQYHFTETANQTTSHFDVSGYGASADGGVQVRIDNRIAVQAVYRYLAATSEPTVNARDQKVMIRLMLRVF